MIQHADTILVVVLILAVLGPIGYFIYQSVFVYKSLLDGRPRRRFSRQTPLPSVSQVRRAWRIVERRRLANPGGHVWLTVDEFFSGNTDPASIAPNLLGPRSAPSLKVFRETLNRLMATPGVTDVRIQVQPDTERSEWPFSDTILVFTTLDADEISRLTRKLKPDEVATAPEQLSGSSAVRLWWD